MAEFDRSRFELHLKLLYAGPSGSGKTTSMHVLARSAARHGRKPVGDRNGPVEHLEFSLGRVFGRYSATVHVVSVRSGVALRQAYRHAVRTCDAIVFVADADPDRRINDNVRALGLLMADLRAEGRRSVPLVVQWNKRDLAVEADGAAEALADGRPLVTSVAARGEGVVAAFQRACLPAIRAAGRELDLVPTREDWPPLDEGAQVAAGAEPPPAGREPSATGEQAAGAGARPLGRLVDRARSLFRSTA